MKIIKPAGKSATVQRVRTLHGSTPHHGMARAAGTLLAEKPKNTKRR